MNRQRPTAKILRKLRNRRGAAVVEFALAGSVLFLVIFGAIEFTRLMMMRNLAQDAAYEAARHCMVEGATEQEAIDRANEVIGLMGAKDVSITINDGNGLSATDSTIKVVVQIPMKKNAFIVPYFFQGEEVDIYGNKVVIGEIELRAERYLGYFDPESN